MDPALTAAAIGVGGTVIVGVAGFWANVRNTNKTTALAVQGQVTDRYTKAIEQLGSKQIDVRIGASTRWSASPATLPATTPR